MKNLAASRKNINRVVLTAKEHPDCIGPKFGLLVYRTNLPVPQVAEALGVTKATVYRWFFAMCDVSDENKPSVIKLGKAITKAYKKGDTLPVYGSLADRVAVLDDILKGVDLGQHND